MKTIIESGWPSLWQRVFLVVLAVLNLWVSYVLFETRPVLASVNAAMAVVLLMVLASSSWRKKL